MHGSSSSVPNCSCIAVTAPTSDTLSELLPSSTRMNSGTSPSWVVARLSIHCLRSALWSREYPCVTSMAASSPPSYSPLTEKEVVSTCICLLPMPNTSRARLAIPANSFVGSFSYIQSSALPRQSSLRSSALMPSPNSNSTGLLAKNCGTR